MKTYLHPNKQLRFTGKRHRSRQVAQVAGAEVLSLSSLRTSKQVKLVQVPRLAASAGHLKNK